MIKGESNSPFDMIKARRAATYTPRRIDRLQQTRGMVTTPLAAAAEPLLLCSLSPQGLLLPSKDDVDLDEIKAEFFEPPTNPFYKYPSVRAAELEPCETPRAEGVETAKRFLGTDCFLVDLPALKYVISSPAEPSLPSCCRALKALTATRQ